LRDALAEIDLPLSEKEKEWIMNKNRRRFFVNAINYYKKTRNFTKTRNAFRLTEFSIKDIFKALIHSEL